MPLVQCVPSVVWCLCWEGGAPVPSRRLNDRQMRWSWWGDRGDIGVLAIAPLPSDHVSKLNFFIKASWIEFFSENKANAERRKKGAGENVGLGTRWVSSKAGERKSRNVWESPLPHQNRRGILGKGSLVRDQLSLPPFPVRLHHRDQSFFRVVRHQ